MMAFSRPTLQQIIDRIESDMEARLTGSVSLLRRAILRVLARVFAGAIHIVYGFITFWGEQLFVTTAITEWLDRHGFQWNVPRKAASFATGVLRFSGVDTTFVPGGTRVQDEDGVEFEVTGSGGNIAGGFADLPASAIEAGEAGNITTATPVELIEPITGVTGVAVISDFGGGVDEENDDDYRARILLRIQEPPAGGTAADYERWAKEVAGVSNAWTFPTTPGPGQVTLIFRGFALIVDVYNYIAALMPVTTDLTVDKTDDKLIDFDIRITPNTAELQTAIEDNLGELFLTQAAPGENILRQQINNAISTTGVTDFVIDTVTGAPLDGYGNLIFVDFEYGVLDDVNITDL
jgi:uncharacterized phage protein gp47/JayE